MQICDKLQQNWRKLNFSDTLGYRSSALFISICSSNSLSSQCYTSANLNKRFGKVRFKSPYRNQSVLTEQEQFIIVFPDKYKTINIQKTYNNKQLNSILDHKDAAKRTVHRCRVSRSQEKRFRFLFFFGGGAKID